MHKTDLTTSLVGLWVIYLGVMGLLTTRPDAFAQVGGWISMVTIVLMGFIWHINRDNKQNDGKADANQSTTSRFGSGSRFGGTSPRFGSSDSNTESRFGSSGGSGQRPNPFNSSSRFGSPFGSGNRPPSPFGNTKPPDKNDDDKDDKEGNSPRDNLLNRLSRLNNTDNPFARADDDDEKPRTSSYFFSSRSNPKKDDEKPQSPENRFGARPQKQEEDEKPVELPGFFEDAIRDVLKNSDIGEDENATTTDEEKPKRDEDSDNNSFPKLTKPIFDEDDFGDEAFDEDDFDDIYMDVDDLYDIDDDDDEGDDDIRPSKPDDIPF